MLRSFLLVGALSVSLSAAPKLRLVSSTVGPLSITQGANGSVQTVEAYKEGDGALSLSAASSVSWVIPNVGTSRVCTGRTGTCIPVQLTLNTSSLAKGTYTGTVTISDPSAVDAPQTVMVTVQMGGGVPDRVDLYGAPNGSYADGTFYTNSYLTSAVTTTDGRPWLSLSLDGTGTFGFVFPYRFRATHLSGMAEGTYNGSVTITKSAVPAENKTVPVSFTVTSKPIAAVASAPTEIRLSQNAKKSTQYIVIANRGLSALSLTGATAATTSGGPWLSAQVLAGTMYVQVMTDPTGMAVGRYSGSVTVTSNAANSSLTVPINFEVIPAGAPRLYYRGLVNNITFAGGDALSRGEIVALFGEQMTMSDPLAATTLPLGDLLNGVRVYINEKPVPLYYSSYGQVNLQIPFDATIGDAAVRVERNGESSNKISVQIAARAPRIMRLGIGDYGIIVNQDGSFPIPVTAGISSHPAKAGDYLVIYALGLGETVPPVASGAGAPAAEPFARVPQPPKVIFTGGSWGVASSVDPLFVGLTPNFVGLYQINVQVPPSPPIGTAVSIYTDDGTYRSNVVRLAIE
ncbi:MAG: hypothetical protein ABFD86_19445 [Bryobacteraceae bacterium]